jgi:RNA-directed DNA polymerase
MDRKNNTDKWKAVDWFLITTQVFRIQRQIYESARRGDTKTTHKLQKLLTKSHSAKLLAVRLAAELSKGKHTPGVDGISSLTPAQKASMAETLNIGQKPLSVKRIEIPKEGKPATRKRGKQAIRKQMKLEVRRQGKQETRKLGIPAMRDRALQHLINMALEPVADQSLSPHQYGFRKGRKQQDALEAIRSNIRLCPLWVLSIDIEKFFDKISHEALFIKVNAPRGIQNAIERILRARIRAGDVYHSPEEGTPQGGPLSPLLANIALSGLEEAIKGEFPKHARINGQRIDREPRIIIYADDAVILHPRKEVLVEIQSFINDWLNELGLNLNSDKTKIAHTLEKKDGLAGFDFLGCHIQQHQIGKHQGKPFFKGVITMITPSKASQKRLQTNARELINSHSPSKKHNAKYLKELATGMANRQERLLYGLNRIIRGWSNYHRYNNSKETFSKMDHHIHEKLWKWAIRLNPNKPRKWIVQEYFNNASPWTFKTRHPKGKDVKRFLCSEVPIEKHTLVIPDKSYFDGDWPYWAKRQGRYLSIPGSIAQRIQSQGGKCSGCSKAFTRTDHVKLVPRKGLKGGSFKAAMCRQCIKDTSEDRDA